MRDEAWGSLQRWWGGAVAKAPVDIELCEFECSRADCGHEEWENCKLRQQFVERSERRDDVPKSATRNR